jgi:hypothetical protein
MDAPLVLALSPLIVLGGGAASAVRDRPGEATEQRSFRWLKNPLGHLASVHPGRANHLPVVRASDAPKPH